MPPTAPDRSRTPARPIDWRAWVALGWALWFGLLYARMVLSARAPGALRSIGRVLDSIGIGKG
jgi:hypothetical protein